MLKKEEPKVESIFGNLTNFMNQEFLADITLKDPSTDENVKAHKVILASGSEYLYEQFKEGKMGEGEAKKEEMAKEGEEVKVEAGGIFNIPPFIQTHAPLKTSPLPYILKYLYSSQNLASIENDLPEAPLFGIYSAGYILKVRSLIRKLEEYICNKYLNVESAPIVYLEGIRFESEKLIKESHKLIIANFEGICKVKTSKETMSKLPLDSFKEIVGSDELNVKEEVKVMEMIKEYIELREALVEGEGGKEKEEPKSPMEKEEPKSPMSPKEEDKEEGEGGKEGGDKGKEPADKGKGLGFPIQLSIYDQIKERLKIRKLLPEEQLDLMSSIRFSHLTHDQLTKVAGDPLFSLAKDHILEGFSVRLSSYDKHDIDTTQLKINIKPRVPNEEMIAKEEKRTRGPERHTIEEDDEEFERENPMKDPYTKSEMGKQFNRKEFGDMDFQRVMGSDQMKTPSYQLQKTYQGTGMEKDNYRQTFHDSPKPPQKYSPEAKERFTKSLQPQVTAPTEFVYNSDFDENGALYFLGTCGKTRMYQNPHALGQIRAFATSIGQGRIEDFVGRTSTNCRTKNDPKSHFGIDLTGTRRLIPTCYSIMNRNINSHILMNWELEGSTNGQSWSLLDRRIYLSSDPQHNLNTEEERNSLIHKGATSTWGIDSHLLTPFPSGFRFFRIVQIGKNSSKGDNLALSGFEIYGKVTGGRWP